MIDIRFWGVRGSIASSSPSTVGVGGNTSCVEVCAGKTRIVFDAGTGLRGLGASLSGSVELHLLLSHFHWDHIQGFPFFGPAYVPGNRIHVYGPERSIPRGSDVRGALDAQMRPPHFPVGLEAMRADLTFKAVSAGNTFAVGEATTVRTAAACHPNGCLAYRVDHGGRSVVYATDTEHDGLSLDANLVDLALNADVLIYDAQYTEPEHRAGKRGWGHSTAEEAVRIARAAKVGQLVLFHHDPARSDDDVALIEAETRALFALTTAAREGLEIKLDDVCEEAA